MINRIFGGVAVLFLLLMSASVASAAITVTLSDGTTTKNVGSPLGGFRHTSTTTTTGNVTLTLLTCATKPCTVHFPSGAATPQPGDTFGMRDISSLNLARIEKIDIPAGGTATTGADSVALRGIKVFSLQATARTFTMTFGTQTGDLTAISSSSGNYAGAAKIKGQFRTDTLSPLDGLTGSIPTSCNSGESTPCVQLSTRINLLTLNGGGSTASALVTASIPCSSASTTAPCGSGGFWSPTLVAGDQFLSSDTGSVGCGTTCAPFWQSTLVVKTNAANQFLTLTNSVGFALAPDTPEGLVSLAQALAEDGIDVWVGACGGVLTGTVPYRVTGLPPFDNKGRNQSNNSHFPISFSGEIGEIQPATGGLPFFVSLNDFTETEVPPSEQIRNSTCSMSFVPSPTTRPKLSAISELTLNFTDFVTGGPAYSGDPRLGDLNFSDCTACFRVEISLVDGDGLPAGTLIVYLGNNGNDFYRTNHDGSPNSLPLASDPLTASQLRVDATGMVDKSQPCCISFADAKGNNNYGKLFVGAITVLIEQDQVPANHLVTNLETIVNGSSSNASMYMVPESSFQPITCTGDSQWPPADGLKIYIYRVEPNGQRTFVFTVLNPTVDSSCKLSASVATTSLGNTSGTYEAHVIAYSGATIATQEFVGGIAIPNPGIMILK